ncbi:hypothetical protein EDC04DRAFT_2908221 [Pisolithus marmoratus]|nr:hypothetical protein EDC04DRAFT_2908221 [Pisolithus marmoratus]
MDDLPELADNGHNWPTYGSWVLHAIADEGLMGLLVGSETRPVHPAQQKGLGEDWSPQTNEERDEVTAWRTADESWQRRNATVNLLITYGISDYIFSFILLLKTPLEKFAFLEKRFGLIPRPDSWLAAEEGTRQSDSQPEQSAVGETAQSTCNSHNEPEKPSSEEADSPGSPNDCTETKSRYLTPESEVIDVRQVEPYLPVVEVGTVNSKQPDERDHTGVTSTSFPANTVAAEQPTVVLHKCTEIAYGPMAPEATIVDVQSQVAGSCAANSNKREGECTEIPTGYLEPETDIIDVQQTEPDEHADMLEVPDERSQGTNNDIAEHQTLPEWTSGVSDPADNATRYSCGRSIENASIECNEDIPMDGKTVANVPDPPGIHAEPATSHDKRSTLQNKPPVRIHNGTVTELKLPCTRSEWTPRHPQRTRRRHSTRNTPPDKVWGVGVHKHARTGKGDSTDIRSTATKPEIRATSAQMVDTPADLPHLERCPKEPDKAKDTSGGGDDKPSSEFSDSHGVRKLMLAGSGSQRTEQEVKRSNGLPVPSEMHANGFIHPPRTLKDTRRHGRIKTGLRNICSIETRGYRRLALNVPTSLPHEVSKRLWNIADTCQRQDMPPRRTRNHYGHSDSRMAVSRQWHETTRQDGKCTQFRRRGTPVIPLDLPWERTKWNNRENGDATSSNAVCSHGAEEELLADSRSQHSEHGAQRLNGSPAPPEPPPTGIPHLPRPHMVTRRRGRIKTSDEMVSDAQTRRNAYHSRAVPMRLLPSSSNASKWFWNTANIYWRQWEPLGSMQNDAKQPRILHTAKRLSRSSGIRRDTKLRAKWPNDSPALSKRPPSGLTHTPSTSTGPRRPGRIKIEAENVSIVRTRPSAYRTLAVVIRPLRLISTPTDPSEVIAGESLTVSVRYSKVSGARNVQMRGYPYPGEHTQGSATISPSRQPRKRRKPPWDIAGTYQRQGVPHPWIWGNHEPLYGQNGGLSITVQGQSARTTSAFPKREVATMRRINTTKQHSLYTRTRSSLAAEYTLVY